MQVFLLGRQLRAVWGTVRCPPAVGSAQQHHHHEDPCSLRYSSSSHLLCKALYIQVSPLQLHDSVDNGQNRRFERLIMVCWCRCCYSHVDEWIVHHGDHRWRGQTDHLLEAPELSCAPPSSSSSNRGDWSFPVSHTGQQVSCTLNRKQTANIQCHGAAGGTWWLKSLQSKHKGHKSIVCTLRENVQLQLYEWRSHVIALFSTFCFSFSHLSCYSAFGNQ